MALRDALEITAARAGMQLDLLIRIEDGTTRASTLQIEALSSTLGMPTNAAYAGIAHYNLADK